jgi:hypothetical protein
MKFTAGLIAGSIIGMVGVGYAMSDRRSLRRLQNTTRRALHKAGDIVDDVTHR